MLAYSMFPGDNNQALMWFQNELYPELGGTIVGKARERYLSACRLLQAEDEFSVLVRVTLEVDHRTFQDAHDLIAAWFRFWKDDHGQLVLGESEEAYRKRIGEAWRAFFNSEVDDLIAQSDEFTRAVLIASCFGNTERGYAAEKESTNILRLRYREMTKFDQDQDEDSE